MFSLGSREDDAVNCKFIRTEEQNKIIEALSFMKESETMKVNAFAGTGKTATLKEMVTDYPDNSFLYLAFNKSTQLEASEKFPQNVKILTTHSFARKYVINDLGSERIKKLRGSHKPKEICKLLEIDSLPKCKFVSDVFTAFCESPEKKLNKDSITRIVHNSKKLEFHFSLFQKEWSENTVFNYVKKLFDKIRSGETDITFDFYLKYFHLRINEYLERINYDVVLLDEAQDTNDVTIDIFQRLPGKKVFVGDTHQQIYSFRGSVDALHKMRFNHEYYLTKTFRCPKDVINKVNVMLHKFKNCEYMLTAGPKATIPKSCDAYIARTNAGMIQVIDRYINDGFITIRKPGDIFNPSLNIYNLLKYFDTGDEGYYQRINLPYLKDIRSREALELYIEETDGIELFNSIKLVDRQGGNLFELFRVAKENYEKINENEAEKVITTVHTAKGKEWNNVYIQDDYPDLILLFAKNNTTLTQFKNDILKTEKRYLPRWQRIIEEINLVYVAIARAVKNVHIDHPNLIELFDDDIATIDNKIRCRIKVEAETVKEEKNISFEDVWSLNNFNARANVNRTEVNSSCPRCGARMRIKNGRYGPFLGCVNYPKCRYTCNTNEHNSNNEDENEDNDYAEVDYDEYEDDEDTYENRVARAEEMDEDEYEYFFDPSEEHDRSSDLEDYNSDGVYVDDDSLDDDSVGDYFDNEYERGGAKRYE
ncbi:MAG: UvrD-helicase domain-containing protein [Patescibacteria group bacterium]|nr:UvrD-helicase domain-containing protein [Patescibacteria group bacterium]